jgi:hypothetical protein
MNTIKRARWIYAVRKQAARLSSGAGTFGRRGVAALIRGRSIMTLILGAVLASWLFPMTVARYQRSVALRDDTARILDALVGTRAELEAAVDRYREAQLTYWQSRLDEHVTAARLEVATIASKSPDPTLVAQREAEKQALTEAAEEFKQAKQLFRQRADRYYITRGNDLFRLQILFPQHQRPVRTAFHETDSDLVRIKSDFSVRELEYRVKEAVQEAMLQSLTQRVQAKKLKHENFDDELFLVTFRLSHTAPRGHPFIALTSIVRLLSREDPDPRAAILSAGSGA